MGGSIIILTLLLYFAAVLVISRLTSRGHSDNKAFFNGNRESPWYLVAFGMVGASLSGVTFVSVPGMVAVSDMTYLQTCMGFFAGYIVIAFVLLPLYYKLNLVSIYSYLEMRFGRRSYRTGAVFFFISKLLGAAARLYVVCLILQTFVLDGYGVPFFLTAVIVVALIWIYTRKGGIRTLVWTDTLQTLCLLVSLGLILWKTAGLLGFGFADVAEAVSRSGHSKIFVFDDWVSRQNFFKQFLSGIFITVVMTGLDQDMMQKNLSCRSLKEAKKNMCCYGFAFIPVNLVFMVLGILLIQALPVLGLEMPARGDDLLPMVAAGGYLGDVAVVFFTVGMVSAAFSSADSAMTALTMSFCIDILGLGVDGGRRGETVRERVHLLIALVFTGCIVFFGYVENSSILDLVYVMASYTYGPLLGMFAFGIFTRRRVDDRMVPLVCVLSPLLCVLADRAALELGGYKFGYELLILNGILTFSGLFCCRERKNL